MTLHQSYKVGGLVGGLIGAPAGAALSLRESRRGKYCGDSAVDQRENNELRPADYMLDQQKLQAQFIDYQMVSSSSNAWWIFKVLMLT